MKKTVGLLKKFVPAAVRIMESVTRVTIVAVVNELASAGVEVVGPIRFSPTGHQSDKAPPALTSAGAESAHIADAG
ncbi:MAG: hypothetical protein GC152_11480 [Alphaproteobacteria bacterium]|nr:hypothetical protein [Alphaproteobacteria bacterium]